MIILFKKVGETPLQCVQKTLDTEKNRYTYVGRLDPMADGLLLILENDECTRAEQYRNIDKVYEYAFVVGIETDTYDCLGHITNINIPNTDIQKKVSDAIDTLHGTITLPYPPYSSKTIDGTPLFGYAKQKLLHTITIPKSTTEIFNHKIIKTEKISSTNIKREVIANLQHAPDGFRREEIINDWQQVPDCSLYRFSAQISASSGTYVRAIVHEIGKRIGYPAVTTTITRTKIGQWDAPGRYTLPD